AILGLLAASVAAVGLELASWWSGWLIPLWMIGVVLAAGPLLGALAGLLRRADWGAAAAAVDAHYQLKDRAATALKFLAVPLPTAFHELQILDARTHLRGVEPSQVAPWQLPRAFPYAVAACAVAIVLACLHLGSLPVDAAPPQPLQAILDVAEE